VPVAHVEAGLRSHHWRYPFPEEALRKRITRITSLHFAPNLVAAGNLTREGVAADTIQVVGNPGIDRLRQHLARAPLVSRTHALVLTVHRHEHRGRRLEPIVAGLRGVLAAYPSLEARIVLHPNPGWGAAQRRMFGAIRGAVLLPPLAYADFVQEVRAARLVITDSGGIQEEAPYLGVATVVVREATERPTSLDWPGCVRCAPEAEAIVAAARGLLHREPPAPCGFDSRAPHGDGSAASRIADALTRRLAQGRDDRMATSLALSPAMPWARV
jgi:UDP-N-acetylglucosamine 2-epimerase (non-hydrolysing)